MSKKFVVLYAVVAALAGLSYATTRKYMIATPINDIVVSNLTVNYVLTAILIGGVSGYLGNKKVFNGIKNQAIRQLYTACLSGVVGLLFLVIMSSGGIKMRW